MYILHTQYAKCCNMLNITELISVTYSYMCMKYKFYNLITSGLLCIKVKEKEIHLPHLCPKQPTSFENCVTATFFS